MIKYFKISKHKGLEINLDFLTDEWLTIEFLTKTKQDHPGFMFEFTLLKLFTLAIHFYDSRHWSYENNRFYKEGEELAEYNLTTYNDVNPRYLNIKLIAKSKEDKEELLNTSEYIHDFMVLNRQNKYEGLDNDFIGVNWLMHLYTSPDVISIDNSM